MTLFRRLALSGLITLSLALGSLFASAPLAFAQASDPLRSGLTAVGGTIVLPDTDPRVIAARIINIFLGFMGIVLVALIVYAGFLYMTSGGDVEKTDRAKAYIRNAIIGLIIVVSSWAIATFVINQLISATGEGGGVGGSSGGPGGLPGGAVDVSVFQVRSITPAGDISIRNVEVRFLFTRELDSASASSSISVARASDGAVVGGALRVAGSLATFIPRTPCPEPNADRWCFDENTEYIARVAASLQSAGGNAISCGGFSPACEGRFRTGSLVDTEPPRARITAPFDGQSVPVDNLVRVFTTAGDDAGVSFIESFADDVSLGRGVFTATSTPQEASAEVPWDTTGAALGRHSLKSRVFDIDSNDADSRPVGVYVRPAFCFSGIQDGDETGLDCGGSCGACSGSSCSVAGDCASGVCPGGVCVEQPVITNISPADGRPGTLVTISGVNFGTSTGDVVFTSGKEASAPTFCSGINTWTPTQVIVSVPEGSISGAISLRNTVSNLTDITNDGVGPALNDFIVNDAARPGLCGAVPSSGESGERLELVGAGLGTTSERVFFNADREYNSFLGWQDNRIALNAPVLSPATYGVAARSGGVLSNRVAYSLRPRVVTGAPVIDSVTPEAAPVGEYITIQGRNFGSRVGRVILRNAAGDEGSADVSFPEECATNFWNDRSIIVKVPSKIGGLDSVSVSAGAYSLRVSRQDFVESASASFNVNDDPLRPGLCAVRPVAGPINTEVQIIGERFGSPSGGKVMFKGAGAARVEAAVDPADWTSTKITGNVPSGAQTGSVTVEKGTLISNPVEFTVRNCNEDASICSSGGETCCGSGACSVGGACPTVSLNAQYAWRISTGRIPVNPEVIEDCRPAPAAPASPSPWDDRSGGDRACVNSDIVVRFNTHLNSASVTGAAAATFIVRRCTSAASDPCSTTEPVSPAAGYPRVADAGSGDYILFRPNLPESLWAGGAIYEVILRTGIKSDADIPMLPKAACGEGNAYCFRFATRPGGDVCTVGSVSVLPHPYTATSTGETVGYQAFPRASDDICLALNGSVYNWAWDTGGDGRASITNNRTPSGNVLDRQTGTAIAETGPVPVEINGRVSQESGLISGAADLFIRFVPPTVVAYGPNCNDACQNAAIWARFNTAMDGANISSESVIIKRCTNENCRAFDLTLENPRVSLRSANYMLVESTLEAGRFYKVILKASGAAGLRSVNHMPLTGLNDPEGFAWTFRVKTGENARCLAERVDVTPLTKTENIIGARQSFAAEPVSAATACNDEGEPLIVDAGFSWRSSNTDVAQFVSGFGVGLIDTRTTAVSGCSSRCTLLGASGAVGSTASCGNSIVETTNGLYCRNAEGTGKCAVGVIGCRTIHGAFCKRLSNESGAGEECDDGIANGPLGRCSTNCLWNPSTAATCGNGVLNPGEQCDGTPAGCSENCQLLGSSAGGSQCGNDDVGDGEACDDGNRSSGDGCNADCLHEGSRRVLALCGNGTIERGEECDAVAPYLPWPSPACDTKTCLKKGSDACGNGETETSEECEDGNIVNGDGCSSRCLLEGSSLAYLVPSFCGDGSFGAGEAASCETAGGDGRIDAVQLSQIVGAFEPDGSGRMSSTLSATFDEATGEATHALRCGFTAESSCPAGSGLTANSCCALRPRLVANIPPDGGAEVCRNVLISGAFDQPMDAASIQTNLIVAKASEEACEAPYTGDSGLHGWLSHLGERVRLFFLGRGAEALNWCAGIVRGRVSVTPQGEGSRVGFLLERSLEPNARYKVTFRGDPNLADAIKEGIKSARGVVVAADSSLAERGSFTWSFTTGNRVCSASEVRVSDTNTDSPALFTAPEETHTYSAQVISLESGAAMPISPVLEYSWNWLPWDSSQTDVLRIATPASAGADSLPPDASVSDVAAQNKNGSSFIFAGIRITNDSVNVPSSTGSVLRSSLPSTVILCERPWPERIIAPFSDADSSPSLLRFAPSFAAGPFFNFSTHYCQDAGEPGAVGDLPEVNLTAVPLTDLDKQLGILRQYLFTFNEDELRGDGIGVRIVQNPRHLSASAWYASRGFAGSPTPTTVDGYEALRDQTTVYIAGTNVADSTEGDVYSNIYVVSYNPNASDITKNIFNQLIENFRLNVNIENNAMNSCIIPSSGEPYETTDGSIVKCTADWECAALDSSLSCASFKSKIQRDTKRIADFQNLNGRLESASESAGKYPDLLSGSFLQTITNSRWPSWLSTLGGALGGSIPTDPINRFLTCGKCGSSEKPCVDSADCGAGETCNAAGADPATCWNDSTRQFVCPRLGDAVGSGADTGVSRIYQYRSLDGGQRFELGTELEGPSAGRYVPPLIGEIKTCSNVDMLCSSDLDCDVRNTAGTILSYGSCTGKGGRFLYNGICSGVAYGSDSVCGNGVIGPGELCEIGQSRPASCATSSGLTGTKMQVCKECASFVDAPSTVCVPNLLCGNGRVDSSQCLGGVGYRYGQACSTPGSVTECRDSRDDPSSTIRCALLDAPEVCDDGALNGTYGRCNRICSGYDAYCGDGELSPGESCDNASFNGTYWDLRTSYPLSQSCSFDCRSLAPYCGDGAVSAPERCDGGAERTERAICSTNNEPCDVADASTCLGGTCGGGSGSVRSCVGVTVGLCSNDVNDDRLKNDRCTTDELCVRLNDDGIVLERGRCIQYPTQHVRSCYAPGESPSSPPGGPDLGGSPLDGGTDLGGSPTFTPDGSSGGVPLAQCTWKSWSACEPVGACDDGAVNEGEECDDGNAVETDSCTNLCRRNTCGDGIQYRGVEECDYGLRNGTAFCSADYGSTCNSCSMTCRQVASSGGFCGNGVKDGPEQCDGSDLGTDEPMTCRGLGFDYAAQYRCEVIVSAGDRLICTGSPPVCRLVRMEPVTVSRTVNAEDLYTVPRSSAGLDDIGKCVEGTVQDIVSCNPACGFSGCGRCSDTGGTATITGTVMDAVNYVFPVPNARVTLYSGGLQVAQTFTDGDGAFTFDNLNSLPQCANYRIVVDSYLDNPCTGTDQRDNDCAGVRWSPVLGVSDEGALGGYWPYTSDYFSVLEFRSKITNNEGKIYLVPRVGPDETLAVVTFNGSRTFRPYLLMPEGYFQCDTLSIVDGRRVCSVNDSLSRNQHIFQDCDISDGPEGYTTSEDFNSPCTRALYWGLQGNSNLAANPHAEVTCRRANPTASGLIADPVCDNMVNQTAPFVIRYKRGTWNDPGFYSMIVEDQNSGDEPSSYEYFQNASARAVIVTQDRYYTVSPPSNAANPPSCTPGPLPIPPAMHPRPWPPSDSYIPPGCETDTFDDAENGKGKYWVVFQQDSRTGVVSFPPTQYCRGEPIPHETLNLPWPSLIWSDRCYAIP